MLCYVNCESFPLLQIPANATYSSCTRGCGDQATRYKITACNPGYELQNGACQAVTCPMKGYSIPVSDCELQCMDYDFANSCTDSNGEYTDQCKNYWCSNGEVCDTQNGYCMGCGEYIYEYPNGDYNDYQTPSRGYSCEKVSYFVEGKLKCCGIAEPLPFAYISFSRSYTSPSFCKEQYITVETLDGIIKQEAYDNNKVKVYEGETVELTCVPSNDDEYVMDWESSYGNIQTGKQVLNSSMVAWNENNLFTLNLDYKSCSNLGYYNSIPQGKNCVYDNYIGSGCYKDCVDEGICRNYNTSYVDYHQTITNCKQYKYITNSSVDFYSCKRCTEYNSGSGENNSKPVYTVETEAYTNSSKNSLTVQGYSITSNSNIDDEVPSNLNITIGYCFDMKCGTASVTLAKGSKSFTRTIYSDSYNHSSVRLTGCSISPSSDSYGAYNIWCNTGAVE